MLKKLLLVVLSIAICMFAVSCEDSSAVSTSSEVTGEKRVVAGTVAAAQYLDALGADVVGVPTSDMELPARYQGVQEIGMSMSPNFELILAADPDLYVADISLQATLEEAFYGKEIELMLLDNNSYDSVETNINLLAEELGLQENAKVITADIHAKKEQALKMAEGKEQPTVAIIFGTAASFMLCTDESYTGDIVNMLGAKNVTDGHGITQAYVTFDREQLAVANPDVILRLSHADPEDTAKAFETEFQQPFWQEIKAVQTGRVYDLERKYFGVTANYDSIDAPIKMAEILYGE